MSKLNLIFLIVIVFAILIFFKFNNLQLGGGSKCFDCEVQDAENGIYRDYGSKCFDCEIQDRKSGIIRSYGAKWF